MVQNSAIFFIFVFFHSKWYNYTIDERGDEYESEKGV